MGDKFGEIPNPQENINLIKQSLEILEINNNIDQIIKKINLVFDNIFDYFNNETIEFTLKDNLSDFNINILKLYQQQLTKFEKSNFLSEEYYNTVLYYLNLLLNVNDAIQNELKTKQK